MKYKIVNTTDGKNLGLIIDIDKEKHTLQNGYTFIPTDKMLCDDFLHLSNSNYIIYAIKIEE